jgi:CSLREA domain-containing protein
MKRQITSRMLLVLGFVLCALTVLSGLLTRAYAETAGEVAAANAVVGTTITVSTTDDELNTDGDCSLREAVEAANTDTAVDACPAGSGWDVINIPAGTYEMSITNPVVPSGVAAAADTAEDDNATGDYDLLDSVTIQGAGSVTTIIDGNELDRIFHLDPDGSGVSLEMSGLTISNGRALEGGAMYIDNGYALIFDAIFSDNVAQTYGGGIYISYGALDLREVTMEQNEAVENDGGGVFSYKGVVTVRDSLFQENSADDGGGIFSEYGTLTVAATQVLSNTAAADGGGIDSDGTAIIIEEGCEIAYNEAGEDGGGVYAYDYTTMQISDSSVHHNSAGEDGGGIIADQWGALLENVDVYNNTAVDEGGGIYAYGDLVLRSSEVSENEADYGGAVFLYEDMAVITNTLLISNTASYGGAIYLEDASGLVMRNSAVVGNEALDEGGGLFIYGSNGAVIEDSAFIANTGTWGGAISTYDYASINADRVTFIDNTTTEGGGAIYVDDDSTADIRNSTFSGNSTDGGGGAIYTDAYAFALENSTLTDNHAGGDGGGIYAYEYSHIQNSIVAGNSANDDPADSAADCYISNELLTAGYNIFGDGTGCDGTRYDRTVDPNDVFTTLLGPLADNDGPMLPGDYILQSRALQSGSAAIDAGFAATCPDVDQRGSARVQGNGCDIGAYESAESATVTPPDDHEIEVTTTEDGMVDDGNCTLQEAVEAANNDTAVDHCAAGDGWDTIILPAGTYVLTDTGELEIDDWLTIAGEDDETTIIDADESDLTTISVNAVVLLLKDVQLTNNSYDDETYLIENDEGYLILQDSTVTEGEGDYGTIYNDYGVARILNSTLTDNYSDHEGGAFYAYYGVTSIHDSLLQGNEADEDAGALYGYVASVRIEATDVFSNSAPDEGGGFMVEYGTLRIADSNFSYNEAEYDGGIQIYDTASTIENSEFYHNVAGDDGAVDASEGVWIRNSEFGYNISEDEAGGIDGGTLIQNSTFHHNEGYYGGATYAWGVIENSIFYSNTGNEGGAIYGEGVILVNSVITGNVATYGGGAYNEGDGGIISINNDFRLNEADEGGAVYFYDDTGLLSRGSSFVENEALLHGGAVYNYDGAVELFNSTVSGNAAGMGGGVYNNDGTVSVNFSTIVDNEAYVVPHSVGEVGGPTAMITPTGGGLYNDSITVVQNSIVVGNQVDGSSTDEDADCAFLQWPFTFAGYSVLGSGTGCDSTAPTDILVDPESLFTDVLEPLDDNGGPTPTHELTRFSSALDAANQMLCPAADQRGVVRVAERPCDSGAYEGNTLFYLVTIYKDHLLLPDLVVQSIDVTTSGVSVVIENIGNAETIGDFWVDVYINPTTPPTGVNQTWPVSGSGKGLVWGISGETIDPGETLTLTWNDRFYDAARSDFNGRIGANDQVYAQVDSWNAATNVGAILENHEYVNGTYNNVFGPVSP